MKPSKVHRVPLSARAIAIQQEMGLGPLAICGLREARAKALDARRRRHEGIDPIDARKAERMRARLDTAKAITFKECSTPKSRATAPAEPLLTLR